MVMALTVWMAGAQGMNSGKTISIDEVRQRLEKSALDRKVIDDIVSSLRAQYGDRAPAVDVARAIAKVQIPTARATTVPARAPDALKVEHIPDGFVLRVSCQSFGAAAVWAIFAGTLAVLPFRIWDDIVRDIWNDGFTWGTGIFAAIWGAALLCLAGLLVFAIFGEIRITKAGDDGKIFTGVGKLGRTHRLQWSDYDGVDERDGSVYSNARFTRTVHFIELQGRKGNYRFGNDLSDQNRALVIDFLRTRVFDANRRL